MREEPHCCNLTSCRCCYPPSPLLLLLLLLCWTGRRASPAQAKHRRIRRWDVLWAVFNSAVRFFDMYRRRQQRMDSYLKVCGCVLGGGEVQGACLACLETLKGLKKGPRSFFSAALLEERATEQLPFRLTGDGGKDRRGTEEHVWQ